MGHQDYVKDLMQRLSKTARGYYIGHKKVINGFVVEWKAETEELMFGDNIYAYDNKFPLPSEHRRISKTKGQLKLTAVVYKCWSGGAI